MDACCLTFEPFPKKMNSLFWKQLDVLPPASGFGKQNPSLIRSTHRPLRSEKHCRSTLEYRPRSDARVGRPSRLAPLPHKISHQARCSEGERSHSLVTERFARLVPNKTHHCDRSLHKAVLLFRRSTSRFRLLRPVL